MKKKYTLVQEFIGKKIKIIKSTCESMIGLQGEVIDETKSTFVIDTSNGLKKKIFERRISWSPILFILMN